MNIDELIASLTKAQAEEYAAEIDQWCWVVDTLLDPYDIPRRFASRVENALDAINKASPTEETPCT